jgi:hypothetical protein
MHYMLLTTSAEQEQQHEQQQEQEQKRACTCTTDVLNVVCLWEMGFQHSLSRRSLRGRAWDKLLPRLDLGGVRALDVGQGRLSKLLLQRLGEQDGELGVVDQLAGVSFNLSLARRFHTKPTGIPKSTAARREA